MRGRHEASGVTLNRPANTHADRPWLAYLQLLRLPNVFTAWADVSMGYLLATGGHASSRDFVFVFVPLIICSSSLYLAGMVLNDVCDYAQDCRQRPQRPLPSGRIDRRQAAALGSLLWALGLAAGWTASWSLGVWHCGAVATTLAGCVLAYDLGGKRTVLGPPLMGACRSLNVLLGMVCTPEPRAPWDLPASWLGVAAGIGVYVAGITWFARQEAGISRRSHLLGATTVMACGILLLAGYAILDAADGSRSCGGRIPGSGRCCCCC